MHGGNLGDSRPVGSGVSENAIDRGPGYRIYYAVAGDDIVLLWGGDKSSQSADIETAKVFWNDYKERTKNEKRRELQRRSAKRP
jgi:putative addiction module killer protein